MKQLGDQWIEVINGQEHMVKAVEKVSEKSYDCTGCIFNGHSGTCMYHSQDCPLGEVEHGYIKDLGILNEDGCLPSPWGGYPKVIRVGKPNFVTYFNVSYVQKSEKGKGSLQVQVTGKTKQEAVDTWNRRG